MPEAKVIIKLKSLIERTKYPIVGELQEILENAYEMVERIKELERELAKILFAISGGYEEKPKPKGGE